MVENYLQALTHTKNKEIEISPLVESLVGVVSTMDKDYKKDYSNYLSKKYK